MSSKRAGARGQGGVTLIELMVALALTAVLGIMLAALVNGWLKVRERLQDTIRQTSVLDFCLALERRFDSPVLRRVYDQRLPLASRWLDWQPASNQLLWVASTGLPAAEGGSRLQRQRLRFEAREQRLLLETSADLYAASAPRWVQWLGMALGPLAALAAYTLLPGEVRDSAGASGDGFEVVGRNL